MQKVLVLLLFSTLSFAQAATQSTAQPKSTPASPRPSATPDVVPLNAPSASPAAAVAPTDPVVTIQGFCPDKQGATGADCKTVITRAEFDKLASALNPSMPESTKRQLASGLAQMVVLSRLAEDRGIDKKPETQEVLRFARMQTLSQLFFRDMQQEAANISPADVQNYYNQHKDQFAQATLQRVFIPKSSPEPDKKLDEAAIKAEATKIHEAAAAPAADFSKLQQQAYTDLGLKSTPPPVDLKDVRRDNLPPGQVKAFDLAPGQLSDVMDEPGGYYLYKMVSKKTPEVSELDAEIRRTVEQERMKEKMEALTAKVKPEFNEAYFGGSAPAAPGAPRITGGGNSGVTQAPPPASKAPVSPAPKRNATPKTPK